MAKKLVNEMMLLPVSPPTCREKAEPGVQAFSLSTLSFGKTERFLQMARNVFAVTCMTGISSRIAK